MVAQAQFYSQAFSPRFGFQQTTTDKANMMTPAAEIASLSAPLAFDQFSRQQATLTTQAPVKVKEGFFQKWTRRLNKINLSLLSIAALHYLYKYLFNDSVLDVAESKGLFSRLFSKVKLLTLAAMSVMALKYLYDQFK